VGLGLVLPLKVRGGAAPAAELLRYADTNLAIGNGHGT
jgi:hypothetical protein